MMQEKKSLITNIVSLLCIGVGYCSPYYGEAIKSFGYFAFSGAITNWLAIYMLFERVPYLYGSGVIPMHFMDFKAGIKKLIMEQFFTEQNMEVFFQSQQAEMKNKKEDLVQQLSHKIDFDKIFDELVSEILSSTLGGMLSMVGGAKVVESLRVPCIRRLKLTLEEVAGQDVFGMLLDKASVPNLLEKIASIVDRRLDELTPKMVKDIIQDMIRKHLGWLVVWGGVFGGLIGLVMQFIE